jgi:hypothetical protein
VELRALAGLGAETRGVQQRRVCGVQLCSKDGSALYSGDCLVLASASELTAPAGVRARAVTRRGADAGVGTSIAAGSAKRANSSAQLRALLQGRFHAPAAPANAS